jgi:alpha-tubulin suppressor-like RCC1 family protein
VKRREGSLDTVLSNAKDSSPRQVGAQNDRGIIKQTTITSEVAMENRKILLPALFSIALVFSLILPAVVAEASDDYNYPVECDVGDWTNIIEVAGGDLHTLGLKSDGIVVAVGDNRDGQCDVGGWTGINQTAAGGGHTVGLKSDGTVVAVGRNDYGQCDVGNWTDIKQVAAGGLHTVGLKYDGTVVAVGRNDYGQCDVGDWTNTTQVAANGYQTVGLKSEGTVVAVGDNSSGQCNVGGWTNITQVAAGGYHTVGLKSDGSVVATVVTVGWKDDGQCNVGGWTNTTQVAAGWRHTVGLKDDGTVVAVGGNYSGQCDVEGWTDIIQVAAGWFHTLGLKSNGTVVAAGGTALEEEPAPGCFIATAAYGTPMAEEIQILREFRDEYLLTNPLGQALVDLYYRVSPPMAEFITEHPSLKPIVRAGLLPAVAMSAIAVNTTPAEKASIIGLVVLVSVALAIWAKRRRGRGPEYT